MKEVENTLGYNPIEKKKIEDGVAKLEAKEKQKKEKAKLQEENIIYNSRSWHQC